MLGFDTEGMRSRQQVSQGNKSWAQMLGHQLMQAMTAEAMKASNQRPNKKGAGNSNASRAQAPLHKDKEGWFCLRADCRAAAKKIMNYGVNKVCFECQRDKCSAMNPPAASRVAWAAQASQTNEARKAAKKQPAAGEKAERSRETPTSAQPAAKAARQERQAPSQEVSEDVGTKKPRWEKMSFTTDELASLPGIAVSIKDILASVNTERMPTTADEMMDASAVFARLTDSLAPCASLSRQAELDGEIHSLQAALMSLDPQRDAVIMGPIKERLEIAKDQRNKITKRTPTDAALLSALREARSSYERAISDRLDRLALGIARAEERKQSRRDSIKSLRQELDLLEQMLNEKEEQAASAFSSMNTAQASLEATVLGLFDTRLKAVQQAQDAAMDEGDITRPFEVAASQVVASVPTDIRVAASAVEAQLLEAQKELQRTLATLEAQRACIAAENAFNTVIEATEAKLPRVVLKDEQHRTTATLWHHFLEHWYAAGGVEHFSVAMVEAHAESTSLAQGFLPELLGEHVWNQWHSAQPKEQAVVPRQVAHLAHAALKKLQAECAEEAQREAIKLVAGSSFAQVTAQNKKRRAGM